MGFCSFDIYVINSGSYIITRTSKEFEIWVNEVISPVDIIFTILIIVFTVVGKVNDNKSRKEIEIKNGVNMVDIKDIHPIGIGTWTISKSTYDKDIKGLLYSFEKGQNSIECNA